MPYVLPQTESEIARLDRQNLMFRRVFHSKGGILPDDVSLGPNTSAILDAAAGSLSWLQELAEHPDVKSRRGGDQEIELYASDISHAKFPAKSVIGALGIKTFLQDLTKPFPEEVKGKFDIVSMTMLVMAFDEEAWSRALQNVREVLKPGGKLILCEPDYKQFFTKDDLEKIASGEASAEDLRFSSTHGTLNRIFEQCFVRSGHLLDVASRLPDFLHNTGYQITQSTRYKLPIGNQCKAALGPFGQTLDQEGDITLAIPLIVFESVTKIALKHGYLSDEEGRSVMDNTGRQELETRVRDALIECGAYCSWAYVIATCSA